MGSVSVSSCRCSQCWFCMTFSLLMLVEDERGDHMEEAYSRDSSMPPRKHQRALHMQQDSFKLIFFYCTYLLYTLKLII